MGKALMVWSDTTAAASGSEWNIFGSAAVGTTETNAQVNATEEMTFSGLRARIISGNSGTATFLFRNNTANGNQTFQITGTGVNEDGSNQDTVSSGNEFNIAYTDTGSNSGLSFVSCQVSFSSGHGNIHGSATPAGAVADAASETRFFPLAGTCANDGSTNEDLQAWKVRGYDSFPAFCVNVSANARTNDSVFKNRINKADGSGTITYGAGATGILTATGLTDTISDGQVVDVSLTLLTGVEDLTITAITGTLKSSTSESETFSSAGSLGTVARTASAIAHYLPPGGRIISLTAFTEAQARVKVGFACIASNLRIYVNTNTYASAGTLKLYVNGTARITTTLTAGGGAGWYENTSDTYTLAATDEISFELDEGGASGQINLGMIGVTLQPAAAATPDPNLIFRSAPLDGVGLQGRLVGNQLS